MTVLERFKLPDWPVLMRPIWSKYFFENLEDKDKTNQWKLEKSEWVKLVQNLLIENKIYIAKTGINDDSSRKSISKIIVHHSKSDQSILKKSNPEILAWINALQLIRQYGDYFSNPKYSELYNQSVYSGHYLQGKQIFIAYHWLIFPNGESIQTLQDEYVGWHCRSHNTDSLGICLVGDFTNLESLEPTAAQIFSAHKIIQNYQQKYNIQAIFGHRELVKDTVCPGTQFLGDNGWKKKLFLRYI